MPSPVVLRPTLERRIDAAYGLVLIFNQRDGRPASVAEEDIVDLIADLLHLAGDYGEPESMLREARDRYYCERAEEVRDDA